MRTTTTSPQRTPAIAAAGEPTRSSRVAMVAALACTLLAAIQSVVWHGVDAPGWLLWLLPALGDADTFVAASSLDQPGALYFTSGRLVWGVFLALLASSVSRPVGGPPWIRLGLRSAIAAAFFGDVLAYGASQLFGPELRALGFWRIEVPALAASLALATGAGIAGLRHGRSNRASDAAFALALPLAGVALAIFRYMPHGLLLPLVWAFALRKATVQGARTAAPATIGRVARLGGLAALGTLAILAVSLPYRPIDIAGPDVDPSPLELPAPLPGLRLHVFNTGANRMSSLLVGDAPPWRAVPAFVIEHPGVGLVVFDCGLSPAVAERGEAALPAPLRWLFESRGRPGLTLDAQMREAGLAPLAVRFAIISHLHADHLGAAPAFENATFLAGPGTRQAALFGAHSPFPADRKPAWSELEFETRGRPLGPFESALDLFGDASIHLIRGGGHTPEDVMALVNLPGGAVLLAGDVIVHRDWLAAADVERIAAAPERAATLRNQVRALLQSESALLLPGHDLRFLGAERPDLVRHRPELFPPSAWPIEKAGG